MSNTVDDTSKEVEPSKVGYVLGMLAIGAVAFLAFSWLNKMLCVLSREPKSPEIWCNLVINEEEPKRADIKRLVEQAEERIKDSASLQAYYFAEERLRGTLNTWLSVLGFFGVIFGLIAPLTSFFLQRRSLLDERERIDKDIKEKISLMNAETKRLERMNKDIGSRMDKIEKRLLDTESTMVSTNERLNKISASDSQRSKESLSELMPGAYSDSGVKGLVKEANA